jgi:uncharacterized protein YegJ (DUF2314 family)
MKRAMLLLSAFLVFSTGAMSEDAPANREAGNVTQREGEPEVRNFRDDDPAMNEAMRTARSTLSEFEQRLTHPPATQSYISLKARFEENGHVEHMWLDDVEITADGYRGTLGNRPVYIKAIGEGSDVQVKRSQVSDWMAFDDGKLVGGYTVRVQRDRMRPGERAIFEERFGVKF